MNLGAPRVLVAVAVAAMLVTGACGDDDDTTSPTSEPTATTQTTGTTESTAMGSGGTGQGGTTITIKDFTFAPATLTAKVGDTITVLNEDGAPHTVTANDQSFDSGRLQPDSSGTIKVEKPGTFAYHCEIHEQMKGTLEVQG